MYNRCSSCIRVPRGSPRSTAPRLNSVRKTARKVWEPPACTTRRVRRRDRSRTTGSRIPCKSPAPSAHGRREITFKNKNVPATTTRLYRPTRSRTAVVQQHRCDVIVHQNNLERACTLPVFCGPYTERRFIRRRVSSRPTVQCASFHKTAPLKANEWGKLSIGNCTLFRVIDAPVSTRRARAEF